MASNYLIILGLYCYIVGQEYPQRYMAKITIMKTTTLIRKYVMYVYMLFCFVEAIID